MEIFLRVAHKLCLCLGILQNTHSRKATWDLIQPCLEDDSLSPPCQDSYLKSPEAKEVHTLCEGAEPPALPYAYSHFTFK